MNAHLRLLADEDFDRTIVRGLKRRVPEVDLVRVQEEGLSGQKDPAVLEWAAQDGRIVLSHDVQTMTAHAWARVDAGLPMPGVWIVPQALPIARAIEELTMLVVCSRPREWENQVLHLPL